MENKWTYWFSIPGLGTENVTLQSSITYIIIAFMKDMPQAYFKFFILCNALLIEYSQMVSDLEMRLCFLVCLQ